MFWRIAPLQRFVQAAERALHGFYPLNIRSRLMVAATLPIGELEPSSRKLIAGPGAAEMDQRCQLLPMRLRRGCHPMTLENRGDASV
jgi:hypothetical protein